MKCKDCKGTGSIKLFVSRKPCAACGGTGETGYFDLPGVPVVPYHRDMDPAAMTCVINEDAIAWQDTYRFVGLTTEPLADGTFIVTSHYELRDAEPKPHTDINALLKEFVEEHKHLRKEDKPQL